MKARPISMAVCITIAVLVGGCTAEEVKQSVTHIAYETAISYDCAKNTGPDYDAHKERCNAPSQGGRRVSYSNYRNAREEELGEAEAAAGETETEFEIQETIMER